LAVEYEMPRRADHCAACQHPFEVGDVIQACLVETPTGYDRRDYCGHCEVPAEPRIGLWRTHRRAPAVRHSSTVFDRQAALDFFRRLTPDTPERQQFQFVLALLLWRKKALVFESSRSDDQGETWRFAVPKSDEAFELPRPELDEQRMDQLGSQLELLLSGAEIGRDEFTTAEISEGADG
jgi:hypothetical protein